VNVHKRLLRRTFCITLVSLGAAAAAVAGPASAAGSRLAPTPPMGWNSFNAYACDNGAQNMEAVAKFMHASGLQRDGYTYVNSDGCYDDNESLGSPNTFGITAPTRQDPETCGAINGRLPDGELFVNAYDFPPSRPCANDGFRLVGQYVHSLGLKLGVYLDASNNWNCEEIPGSYQFDTIDADTLAWWGADYVKADWGCSDTLVPPGSDAPTGYTGIDADPGNQGFGGPTFSTNRFYDTGQENTQIKMYTALGQALAHAGRPMVFSVAGAGTVDSQTWGLQIGELDRPTGDANANFTATGRHAAGSVVGIVNADAQTYDALTGPGHWIDPDIMEVGNGSLTPDEDRSEMSMFSEMSDPLIMSTNLCPAHCGPDTTPATPAQLALDVSVFGNRRVIAVDQDRLGSPAHIVGTFDGTHLIMAKPLANGDVAVTLFNESTTDPATMSTTAAAVGLPAGSTYHVEDLWSGQSSTTSGAISAVVPPTATVMYRVSLPSHHGWQSSEAGQGRWVAAPQRIASPSGGSSSLHLAGPLSAGRSEAPRNLMSVACPSAQQCTAVDIFGAEVTFDPTAPGRTRPVAVDDGQTLVAVSCPAAGQCTALDRGGSEVTFVPSSGRTLSRRAVDAGNEPTGLTCVSAAQCTAVDGKGQEVTFTPGTGRTAPAGIVSVDPDTYLASLACPSLAQCTAVGGGGNNGDTVVSFDPASGAVLGGGATSVDPATVNGLSSVACPTSGQCTAVDGSGNETTFDPIAGTANAAGVAPIEGAAPPAGAGVMTSVACPSASQCTAVDQYGNEVTFDPASGTVNAAGVRGVDAAVADNGLESVTCQGSGAQCTAVDLLGQEVTFDPATGAASSAGIAAGLRCGLTPLRRVRVAARPRCRASLLRRDAGVRISTHCMREVARFRPAGSRAHDHLAVDAQSA
jgi:alpha-galactosidase